VISNLVFLGVLLILGGAGQLLFRHKWADSVLGITSDSRLKFLKRLSKKLILKVGVGLMVLLVALGVVLVILGIPNRP
jgi:hypothetical protein